MARATWRTTWRFGFGIAACAFVGWFAFVKSTDVPILAGVELASHEFGHFATSFLPRLPYFMAGSVFQILMPLGLAGVFLWQTHDLLGVSVCLAWAAAACSSVAIYIADAPHLALQLIGGEHDWAFILGPEGFNALGWSSAIAAYVRALGVIFLIGGFAAAFAGPWWVRRREARQERDLELASAAPLPGPATRSAASDPDAGDGWAVVPPWEAPGGSQSPPDPPGSPGPKPDR